MKKSMSNDYLDYRNFKKIRNKKNLLPGKEYNHVCLLRNKKIFEQILSFSEYLTPSNTYMIENKNIYKDGKMIELKKFISDNINKILFIKDATGECGNKVYEVAITNNGFKVNNLIYSGEDFINNVLLTGVFIVQEKIIQNKIMNNLYENSVNTLRIVTVKSDGEIKIFAKLLRLGTNNNFVDNWAKGGIVVGINNDGTLKKYGFFKPGYGTKVSKHPDSNIEFEGYKIPYFKLILSELKKVHRLFQDINSIGWDVAILEDGFSIIEGNDNWEISLHQVVDQRSYRKDVIELL